MTRNVSSRFRKSGANALAVGVYLSTMLARYISRFRAYEKDKEEPIFTDGFVAGFKASLAQLKAAVGQQSTGRMLKADAQVEQEAARAALHETLLGMRDDFCLYNRDDHARQVTFGVGTALVVSAPRRLLSVASGIIESWKDKKFQKAARKAGITQASIDGLAAQYAAVEEASAQHTEQVVDGSERTISKEATLAEVSATNSMIRLAARRIFRGQPAIIAKFMKNPAGTTAQPGTRAPKAPLPVAKDEGADEAQAAATQSDQVATDAKAEDAASEGATLGAGVTASKVATGKAAAAQSAAPEKAKKGRKHSRAQAARPVVIAPVKPAAVAKAASAKKGGIKVKVATKAEAKNAAKDQPKANGHNHANGHKKHSSEHRS